MPEMPYSGRLIAPNGVLADGPMGYLQAASLMISTLRHFRYDMSTVEVKMVHGNHCQYVMELNEVGENRLAEIVYPFIEKYSK